MKCRFILGLLACGILACEPLPPDQAHFERGFKAYEKGDFYSALLYLKPLVEEGHPAAELLMAKMYSSGQGVEPDVGKAEFLRNLAAVKIYRHPLPPGVVRPDNATLKSVQDRLDYYTDGTNAAKGAPPEDMSRILSSLDLEAIKRLAAADLENPSSLEQGNAPLTPTESVSPAHETPPSRPGLAPIPTQRQDLPVRARQALDSNQISLSLLRQSAERDDPLALELLSTAYEKGYYGLIPDRHEASVWREKARWARSNVPSGPSEENEPDERLPVTPIVLVSAAGLALMGAGAWLGLKKRKRRAK